jgi:hypothetical protein
VPNLRNQSRSKNILGRHFMASGASPGNRPRIKVYIRNAPPSSSGGQAHQARKSSADDNVSWAAAALNNRTGPPKGHGCKKGFGRTYGAFGVYRG